MWFVVLRSRAREVSNGSDPGHRAAFLHVLLDNYRLLYLDCFRLTLQFGHGRLFHGRQRVEQLLPAGPLSCRTARD